MPSKTFTKWKSIKLVDCIVESHLIGTTKIDVLTSPCQDTSRNNSKSIVFPWIMNIVSFQWPWNYHSELVWMIEGVLFLQQ